MKKLEIYLNFCFKGDRDYVHGTDMFNSIVKNLDTSLKRIDFMIYKRTNKNLLLKDKLNNKDLIIFKFLNNGKIYYGIETDDIVDCRYSFKEEEILEKTELKKRKVALLHYNDKYSFIENIVVANKYLLNEIFPNIKGKWYFTRLQLEYYPIKAKTLNLEFINHLNLRLTKTKISDDKKTLGYIYFSLVEENIDRD